MRIVDIRERVVPLNSQRSNSSFDFSEMTNSVVAVITDGVREGAPVAGFAFNIGLEGQSRLYRIMRELAA